MQWARSGGCKALLKCARWQDERGELIERVKGTQRGGEFEAADENEKLAMILDGACKERGAGMSVFFEQCLMGSNP